MVIGDKIIIPGTCKWARTSEVLYYLPAHTSHYSVGA
jgi:hypothetical protein